MTTFLAQPSALSAPTVAGRDTRAVDAARAGSPAQSSPAASPRPGSPVSEATDPRALLGGGSSPQQPEARPARAVFFVRKPEDWRLRGRPYDPRQSALSRGEQRAQVADRLIYGASGVLGGVMVLYLVVGAIWR